MVFPSQGINALKILYFYTFYYYLDLYVSHLDVLTGKCWLHIPQYSQETSIRAMDENLRGMFKLTRSNYSVSKSKMSDMQVCRDLRLSVQFEDGMLD